MVQGYGGTPVNQIIRCKSDWKLQDCREKGVKMPWKRREKMGNKSENQSDKMIKWTVVRSDCRDAVAFFSCLCSPSCYRGSRTQCETCCLMKETRQQATKGVRWCCIKCAGAERWFRRRWRCARSVNKGRSRDMLCITIHGVTREQQSSIYRRNGERFAR